MLEEYPDVMTVSQFREAAKIGTQRAYDLVRSGGVKGVWVGWQIFIAKTEVQRYMTNRKINY